MSTIRIGTRKSALALWQAHHVADLLRAASPGLEVEIVPMTTRGDDSLAVPLAPAGGKGLFTREIEEALLRGAVDLAVHSLKDLPGELPEGLVLAPPPAREDPRDALVSSGGRTLSDLPPSARVGTASLRRAVQLRALRADLRIEAVRGNVPTRLARTEGPGALDAVVLAAAGLRRLGLADRIAHYFETGEMVPAVGQGILGLEHRRDDAVLAAHLRPLAHAATAVAATAERALLRSLGASCFVPLGGHAWLVGQRLRLVALLADPATGREHRLAGDADPGEAEALGTRLGQALLAGPMRHLLEPADQPNPGPAG